MIILLHMGIWKMAIGHFFEFRCDLKLFLLKLIKFSPTPPSSLSLNLYKQLAECENVQFNRLRTSNPSDYFNVEVEHSNKYALLSLSSLFHLSVSCLSPLFLPLPPFFIRPFPPFVVHHWIQFLFSFLPRKEIYHTRIGLLKLCYGCKKSQCFQKSTKNQVFRNCFKKKMKKTGHTWPYPHKFLQFCKS